MASDSADHLATGAPEQGQLVTVRQRRYVATDVAESALPDSALTPVAKSSEHLVTLSCLEDDALGEELQVIWELEPGARVLEKVDLPPNPTAFDDPARLDAFLDAVRWGAASSADGRWLFISSANLTEYAFSINMELGVLMTGGALPKQVEALFDSLITDGQLTMI